jgi:hypothetical protein
MIESFDQGDVLELIDDIPHGTRCVSHQDMAKAYNQQRVIDRHG